MGFVDFLIGFPAAETLEDALKQLYLIDAIDENGAITNIGQKMAGTRFLSLIFIHPMLSWPLF